jgi:DNA-directed RNA polymerase specialized sigma24 family protein
MAMVHPENSATTPMVEVTSSVLSFGEFFDAHHARLVEALAVTIGDAELAADAVAEAEVKAHLRSSAVGAYRNPAGWVYRVALNWARSRRRRFWRELMTPDPPDRPTIDAESRDPALAAALLALPVEQRAFVVLRHLLDWSESRTAEALDIPTGTAKSRLSRAMRQLAVVVGGSDVD